MKKLITNIDCILSNIEIGSVGVDYDIRVVNSEEVAKRCADECKNISIMFAQYSEFLSDKTKSYSENFDDFIENIYGKSL